MSEWEKYVRKVTPYTPGEQPNRENMVKLNTNECPYPPAPEVDEAMKSFDSGLMRLYPDPDAKVLVDAIAQYHGVGSDEVFVGVGSDDVIAMAFLTFFNSGKPILFPDVTYSFYDVWADLFKIPYKTLPLNDRLEINEGDYDIENGGIIFPNPNAPTAIELDAGKVEYIVSNNQDSVVIVDEAYVDFGGTTALSLLERYKNLLVVRTFSKSRAMAGARIGYAVGDRKLIKAMRNVKFSYNSYTMNRPSLAAGVAALKNDSYFRKIVARIISTRENAVERMSRLGFICTDSRTNFLFATHKCIPAKEIFEFLKTRNIYVRYFDKPRIDNYLRITIGTDEEMETLYQALEEFVRR